jgi:hypothetical protein
MNIEKYLSEQKTTNRKLSNDLRDLTDVFSDGTKFLKFRFFMEGIDSQWQEGKGSAKKIMEIFNQFKRLVDLSQK